MPAPSEFAAKFAAALQDKFADKGDTFTIDAGGKYDRIVQADKWGSRHVHAFVVRETGGLVKSAGWKAPQKEKNGLAVRYVLSVQDEFDAAIEDADPYGGYLYAGRRTLRPVGGE